MVDAAATLAALVCSHLPLPHGSWKIEASPCMTTANQLFNHTWRNQAGTVAARFYLNSKQQLRFVDVLHNKQSITLPSAYHKQLAVLAEASLAAHHAAQRQHAEEENRKRAAAAVAEFLQGPAR